MTVTGATERFEDRTLPPLVLPPDEEVAAPLRDASRGERLFRCLLAALVVAYLGFTAYESLRRPTVVTGGGSAYQSLLDAANTGRVTRIDDSGADYVLWRHANGHVYAHPIVYGVDLRASVAAQPYVRAHPRSVTYAPIAASAIRKQPWRDVAEPLAGIALLLWLVTGPPPRHLTRWGWFWIVATSVGTVPYVLLSGSRYRTVTTRPRRRNGAFGVAVAVAFSVAAALARHAIAPDQPGHSHAPGTVPAVLSRAA
jgi:hypothetical protein